MQVRGMDQMSSVTAFSLCERTNKSKLRIEDCARNEMHRHKHKVDAVVSREDVLTMLEKQESTS